MTDWPPLPTLIRGVGGPIKVRRVRRAQVQGTPCWGVWDDAKRIITIDRTAKIEHQWRVLFHELMHAALHDAGIENLFDPKGIETLCDCVATARIQEMRGELGVMDA